VPYVKYTDRSRDVLDLLLAQIVEAKIELVADLVAHDATDTDSARLGESFEPRRHVDPVAIDIVILDDDVAKIDADAELHAPLGGRISVAQGHLALHLDRAAHRVDDAEEFDEQPIAGGFDDAAAVFLDLGVAQLAPNCLQRGERTFLIRAHQPRIAGDIDCHNRRQPPLYAS
jgi:hypothetical protein